MQTCHFSAEVNELLALLEHLRTDSLGANLVCKAASVRIDGCIAFLLLNGHLCCDDRLSVMIGENLGGGDCLLGRLRRSTGDSMNLLLFVGRMFLFG